MQLLVVIVFVVVYARDDLAAPRTIAPADAWRAAALTLAANAALALAMHASIWRRGRLLDRTAQVRHAIRADHAASAWRWAATLLHAACVLGPVAFTLAFGGPLRAGWLDACRAIVGNTIILDELLAVAPPLAAFVLAWWSIHPIERRLREATLIRDLDAGRPIRGLQSRRRFVLLGIRNQLALMAVPLLIAGAVNELIDRAALHAHRILAERQPGPWERLRLLLSGREDQAAESHAWIDAAALAARLASLLCVFVLLPLVIRRIWDTAPLHAGPLRDRLLEMCRRNAVRVRDLLVWRTDGAVINGAVMGLLGRWRYILLTDALLEELPEPEIFAVAAHEIAHVRRRHIPWLALVLVSSALAFTFLFDSAAALAGLPPGDAAALAGLAGLAAALALFGFASRRFEWQADAFAAADLSTAQSSGVILSPAAGAMSDALASVARLNHIPESRRSWRHGSIAERRRRLDAIVGLPIDALPIDRHARAIRFAALALLALTIAAATLRGAHP